jgi:hypothetical protein
MTSEHLTDRIPDVLHGREAWTDADRAHLAACDDCAAEWRLVSGVIAAGRQPTIDAAVLAEGVLRRLRAEPVVLPIRPRRSWRGALIGLAAAASVALAFLVWQPNGTEQVAVVPTREPTMLPELDGLLEADLEIVLAYIAPVSDEPLGSVPRIGDLTDEELELLLAEVEG